MVQPLVVEQTREMPVEPTDAFLGVLQMNVPAVFSRWYGAFPPIKEVVGDFAKVGDARLLKFSGGGSAREELVHLDPPGGFGYSLSEIKGPLALLASGVQGRWTFDGVNAGTAATWQWTVRPRSVVAAPAMPLFATMWRGYARQALEELSRHLAN